MAGESTSAAKVRDGTEDDSECSEDENTIRVDDDFFESAVDAETSNGGTAGAADDLNNSVASSADTRPNASSAPPKKKAVLTRKKSSIARVSHIIIRGHAGGAKLSQMDMEKLAGQYGLSTSQIQEFKHVFDMFERDQGASLSVNEMRDLLKVLRLPHSEEEISKMIQDVELNAHIEPELDFDEFLTLMTHEKRRPSNYKPSNGGRRVSLIDEGASPADTPRASSPHGLGDHPIREGEGEGEGDDGDDDEDCDTPEDLEKTAMLMHYAVHRVMDKAGRSFEEVSRYYESKKRRGPHVLSY
eukprot:Opistho-2@52693